MSWVSKFGLGSSGGTTSLWIYAGLATLVLSLVTLAGYFMNSGVPSGASRGFSVSVSRGGAVSVSRGGGTYSPGDTVYSRDKAGIVREAKLVRNTYKLLWELNFKKFKYGKSATVHEDVKKVVSENDFSSTKPSGAAAAVKPPRIVKCPYCDSRVREKNLESHKKTCAKRPGQATLQHLVEREVKCPYCSCRVTKASLERHKKTCDKRPGKPSVVKPPVVKPPVKPDTPSSESYELSGPGKPSSNQKEEGQTTESSTAGGAGEGWFADLFAKHKWAVIGGAIGLFVLVLVSIIVCACCCCKKDPSVVMMGGAGPMIPQYM